MRDPLVQPALLRNTPHSTMSLDKQKSGTPAKPFTPILSTAIRGSKSPLTPKLAGSKNASPRSPPRRDFRSEPTIAPISRKEDFRSPTTPKLGGHITPRSGARVSRIGGDSPSTPGSNHAGTPSRTRPFSAVELSKPRRYNGSGIGLGVEVSKNQQGIPQIAQNVAKGRVVSSELARRVSTGSQRSRAAESVSPRFYHTNGAQPTLPAGVEETPRISKAATFVYASDATKRTDSPEPIRMTPQPSLEPEEEGKFCYANNRPTDQPSTSRNPAPAVNTSPVATLSPNSQPLNLHGAFRFRQQPSSPVKAASLRSAPATFSSASGNSIKLKSIDGPTKSSTPATPSDTSRRASASSKTSTVRQTAQRKPSNASSVPSTPPKKPALQISPRAYIGQGVLRQPAAPLSPTALFSPRSASLSSSNTGVSSQTLDSTPSNSLHPLSPAKSEAPQSTQLQRSNELAANARRERKVLDLEISNSSLLAINRTLEREMRKQSLELRRFRRISRTRQLSMSSSSMRSVSGQSGLSTVAESEDGGDVYGSLSDLDEEMSDSEMDESGMDSSFDDESSLISPTSNTDHETRNRARDEKRLMHDLGKHQQLLIDSQKMNQSIKRCLGWTEELISEGKKALEYHVRVNDVEIGGKVLEHDEEDEGGGTRRKGLLSPSLDVPTPPAVQQERILWRQGLEEMEMEVDRMLASSTTIKDVVPA